jgi:hypothetical protein
MVRPRRARAVLAAGTGTYYLFVNLGSVPAADRAAAGLRNPGGPIAGPDFGSALIAVGVWQTLLFIAPARLTGQHDHPAPAAALRGQRASSSAWAR